MSNQHSVFSNGQSVVRNGQRTHYSLFIARRSISVKPRRGFTLIELMVVIAIIGTLASGVMMLFADAQRDAKDKRRISDMRQLQRAFELYYVDHQTFPTEAEGANGVISVNGTFIDLMAPYLKGVPSDPSESATFSYYYDGSHRCGDRTFAVVFARQMEKPENANYDTVLGETCSGILDGEGRGGGDASYNIILGYSGG